MYWIVGLGNPGAKYANTRHNVGFMVLDALAARNEVRFRYRWLYAASCAVLPDKQAVMVKPETYMNRSGRTISRLAFWRKLNKDELIAVVDDTALPPGRIRVRAKGSDGGHNGMRSIIDALESEQFVRVRVGVGECPSGESMIEYVLAAFAEEQMEQIKKGIETAADAVEFIQKYGVEKAMNAFNKKTGGLR